MITNERTSAHCRCGKVELKIIRYDERRADHRLPAATGD
jgi:hypothetical protein